MSTRVREARKEAARADYAPRMKQLYEGDLRTRLKEELGLSSPMEVPRIEKITLNMGVGEAKTDAKQLDPAIEELSIIAGQRAQVRKATQVDRAVQDPRGDADRRPRHAARHSHVRVPRPADRDRTSAHP